MEDTALRLQQLHLQRMLEQHEMEKENPPPGGLEYDHVHTPDPDGVHWSSRGSGGMIGVRSKPSPPKKEKGKHSQLSKKASTLPGDQRTTVLLLLDDEKVKPLEVELVSKTYPKEHEAFTSAFLRHNEFARKIFTGGDRLLKWYFQEDHLTFPRLCLIYQNRCSQGRTNPWVSKLIRNGPSLRGPVVVVQQKKSPNAETVVFEQYRRDDRHMLPAAAAFLMMTPVSCGDIPTRSITSVPAIHQRNPMRASAPPLQGVSSGVGLGQGGRTGMMDDGVQPQHPYLSSSVFSPTASPYAMATFSSLPTSPSSSNPSSGSSSPSTTPPSSVPHSPRSSFSSTGFVSSSAMATRPGSASSHSASFPALPMLQQPEGTVNLSGSLPSLPPYTTPHFYSPPLTTATGGGAGGLHEPPGFDVGGGGLIERPTVGSSGSIPVTRSDEFSAFSSPAFPYSLWAAPSPSPTPVSAATPPVPHHPQPSSYSAEGILSLPGQHPVPPQHAQFPVLQPQPLPLSSTGVFAPTQQQQQQQYRPLAPQTASAAASRSAPRHFSWEGPAERPVRAITAPEVLRATYPAPDSAIPHAARRASSDAGAASPRDGVDEQVVGKLKKIRNSPGPATKAQVNRLIHAYEEYTRIRDALSAESGAKRRGLSSAAASGGKSSPSVTRKTKLFCRTMIFDAKMARMSDKCEEDVQNERLVAKWEEVLRAEVRSMLAEGLVDQHLVDRILLACFARRRVQTARELVCEVAKLTPNAVSRDEWHQLADTYEAFSPWLAAFIRQLASDCSAAERPPTEAETRESARVTLRIIRRYTLDLSRACHADVEDQTECDDGSEEEVFLTVAPLAATVGELKHKLWHEQSRLAQQSPQQHQQEGCLPLRPNDMGVLYRFVAMKRGTTAEVHLEDQDVLQDYLLPLSSQPAATASDDASDDFAPGAKDRQTRRGRELADGGRTPAPTYDIVIVEEPRLLAFAHFPDLARSLAELKGLIDREERDLWSDNHLGRRPGSGAASEALARRTRLIDYLCHHFEYLEELHRGAVRRARKDRALRRQRKDAENGYRDDHHQPTLFGRKEKRIEAERREASLERMNGDDDENEAGRYAPETKYIVRFITGSEETLADPWKSQSPPHQQATVERCAIHLGSLTKEDEEPLYAVFTRNPAWPLRSHSRWIFRAWSDELALVELHGLGNATAIFAHRPSSSSSSSSMSRPVTVDLPLPAPARYCASVEDLYLVPGVKLYFSAEHLLANRTNSKRFDQCAYAKDELAFVADSTRRAGLDYALGRCLRTLQNDPSLAVPHSRADASGSFHLEFLAPLYIKPRRSPKPDLVVALERRYDGNGRLGCYVATTLLSPAEAYASARRVKKIRQAWLAAVHQRPTSGSAGHRQAGGDAASAAAAVTRQGVAPARTDNSASASPSNGHISDFKKSYRPSNNIVSRHAVGSNEDRYQQGQPQRQRAAAACVAVMNGADDDEDEDAGEFKFEAEIDKWVSETEGEEESEYHDEDTSSTAST